MRKSRDRGRNLYLKVQPRSGRPVTVTHNLNRQKVYLLIQENQRISQRAVVENVNIDLANANEIIVGLGYAKAH
jgi:hypothetical protein